MESRLTNLETRAAFQDIRSTKAMLYVLIGVVPLAAISLSLRHCAALYLDGRLVARLDAGYEAHPTEGELETAEVPPVVRAGTPHIVAVPSPLSRKLIPSGSSPNSSSVMGRSPVAITLNGPSARVAKPRFQVISSELQILGSIGGRVLPSGPKMAMFDDPPAA